MRPRTGDRALEGLARALLPPEAGGPESGALVVTLGELLGRLPRPVEAAARAGAIALDAVSVVGTGRRLRSLPPGVGPSILSRLARIDAVAPGLDGLKALVLLAEGADRAADEVFAAARRRPPARPDAVLDVTPSVAWPGRSTFDIVVIGSGAGGAMAARTLARAGMTVAVLEEGRRHAVGEFRTRHPLERFTSLYRDGGATAAIGRPPVILPIGRGVGGTTLVNSGTCYRTPPDVLRAWRDDAGLELADPDSFAAHLDDVWTTLEVAPVPRRIMGRNGRLALAGAQALGWHAEPIARNAPGCGGCCQCSIGCPRNAKFGVHLNALPQACDNGARIVAEARAERIGVANGRATSVLARRPDGSHLVIHAAVGVVVAAGATETPTLLRRSGLGTHPMLGRNLALHPSVGVAGRFDEPVVAWRGVLQSASVDEFHARDGILVEATSTPPGMGSVMLPGIGAELVEELDRADHLATLGAMVADAAVGRVVGRRRALVRYDLTPRDGRRLVQSIEVMGRLLFAAGAREVLTGIPGHERVHDSRALGDAVAHARPNRLHVAAFHPVGTAAAGAHPDRSPVDARGALRGVQGVWVADASALPSCPTVNPQVSVMALALAIADRIVRTS